jgi:hypothetical protein
MRRVLILTVIAILAIGFAMAGNEAPPGADYNLQVIAYENCPAGDFTGSNRHMIAVKANYNYYSCAGDESVACDPDDNPCADGSACIEIGECSNGENVQPICEADAECYTETCTPNTCVSGVCSGTVDLCATDYDCGVCSDGAVGCEEDFDCNMGVYCGAGVVPHGKDWDSLTKTNTILLQPGEDFRVLDGNACSRGGAIFQLPAVDVACDNGYCPAGPDLGEECSDDPLNPETCGPATDFSVWIRLVGKPNTKIGVTLCATELGECMYDGESENTCGGVVGGPACTVDADCEEDILCSLDNVIRMRTKGKQSFTDVTDELLTMTVCTEAPCTKKSDYEDVEIFDADFLNFFWNWNTKGKAHAQLRFYAN